MTDLDKIKACARAMGYTVKQDNYAGLPICTLEHGLFNPLVNTTEADALEGWLLERGNIEMTGRLFLFYELSDPLSGFEWKSDMTVAENRRRARVECVAKMMEGV